MTEAKNELRMWWMSGTNRLYVELKTTFYERGRESIEHAWNYGGIQRNNIHEMLDTVMDDVESALFWTATESLAREESNG